MAKKVTTPTRARKDLVKAFKKAGFIEQTGGNHGVYFVHQETGVKIPLGNHGKEVTPTVHRGCLQALKAVGYLA